MEINAQKAVVSFFVVVAIFIFLLVMNAQKKEEIMVKDVFYFAKARKYFKDVNENTLIFFDVDSTLLMPSDENFIRHSIIKYRSNYNKLVDGLTHEEKSTFLHLFAMHIPSRLVDPDVIGLIKDLKKRRSFLFALTASKFSYIGKIFFPQFRYEQLKQMGIDFKEFYPTRKKFTLTVPLESDAGIDNGIIYTGHVQEKGEFIQQILHTIGFTPRDIIMIDDKRSNIEKFGSMLLKEYPSIRFLGIHFRGVETIKAKKTDKKLLIKKIEELISMTKKQL